MSKTLLIVMGISCAVIAAAGIMHIQSHRAVSPVKVCISYPSLYLTTKSSGPPTWTYYIWMYEHNYYQPIKSGAILSIHADNIESASVASEALLDEFGAWKVKEIKDKYMIFEATKDAILRRSFEGFSITASKSTKQAEIQWTFFTPDPSLSIKDTGRWEQGAAWGPAKEEEEKIPKGLKTKTEMNYNSEEFGKYRRVVGTKYIWSSDSDDMGNMIEWDHTWRDSELKLQSKYIYKYDDKGNQIEGVLYNANGKLQRKILYDNKGNEIEYSSYDADGKLTEKLLNKYDDKGNWTERFSYDADGKLTGNDLSKYDDRDKKIERVVYDGDGNLTLKYLFKYDNRGNMIESDWYGADGKLSTKLLMKHDDRDKEIESAWYDTDGKLKEKRLNKYDDRGNWTERASYGADGELTRKHIYKYDDKDNMFEHANYGADGKLTRKCLYKDDARGNMIEGAAYDADGRLTSKYLYKYDGKSMTEGAWYGADGKLFRKFLYKYKYDNKGNITEQVKYKIEEKLGKVKEVPISQTVWEYEFYPKKENK